MGGALWVSPSSGTSSLCEAKAHPLALSPDKAAQLEEHMTHTGNSFWDSPVPVVWDPYEDQPEHLLHMCREIYLQSMLVLWLVVQTLRAPRVQVS